MGEIKKLTRPEIVQTAKNITGNNFETLFCMAIFKSTELFATFLQFVHKINSNYSYFFKTVYLEQQLKH